MRVKIFDTSQKNLLKTARGYASEERLDFRTTMYSFFPSVRLRGGKSSRPCTDRVHRTLDTLNMEANMTRTVTLKSMVIGSTMDPATRTVKSSGRENVDGKVNVGRKGALVLLLGTKTASVLRAAK